eukprot:m.48023 g.48023  ORF g.48023 m.48023 type:complete len:198 (-) comp7371_c0_seq1:326-919(-)
MGFVDWFYGWLASWGFVNKQGKLVFFGLDNAGKSSLLHRLKTGKMLSCSPSLYPTAELVEMADITILAHDVGGHKQARRIWRTYFTAVDAIVFVVDAEDRTRISEAKNELKSILGDDLISHVPICVFGNKIDIPGAASEDELILALELDGMVTGKGTVKQSSMTTRPLEVFMCSVSEAQGYARVVTVINLLFLQHKY